VLLLGHQEMKSVAVEGVSSGETRLCCRNLYRNNLTAILPPKRLRLTGSLFRIRPAAPHRRPRTLGLNERQRIYLISRFQRSCGSLKGLTTRATQHFVRTTPDCCSSGDRIRSVSWGRTTSTWAFWQFHRVLISLYFGLAACSGVALSPHSFTAITSTVIHFVR
jgi:hypothetical protein